MSEILIELRRGSTLILTLNRKDKRNALSSELAISLANAVEGAAQDAGIRSVVIQGAGDESFCSGADLKERAAASPEQKWQLSRRLFDINKNILENPKIFYAAISGWCLGGGFELALACDFRFANSNAVFGWPELKLGAYPGAGAAVMLPRLVGLQKAKALLLNTGNIDASRALELGLVDGLSQQGSALDACVQHSRGLEAIAPLAQAAIKGSLRSTFGLPLEQSFSIDNEFRRPLESTSDYAEGIEAFTQKRKPIFNGR